MNDQTLTNRGRPNTERVGKPNTLHPPPLESVTILLNQRPIGKQPLAR